MQRKHLPLTYSIQWGNPYTSPPNAQPRTLISVQQTGAIRSAVPTAVQIVLDRVGFGSGWALAVHVQPTVARKFKPETKAKIRQNNLRKRAQAKAPLFADHIIAHALATKPAYYAGADYEPTNTKNHINPPV